MSVVDYLKFAAVLVFVAVVIAVPLAAHGLLGYIISQPAPAAAAVGPALPMAVISLAALASHLSSVAVAWDPRPPFLYTRKRKDGTTYQAYKVPGTRNLRVWRPPTWQERTRLAARPIAHLAGRACLLGLLLWWALWWAPLPLVWTLYAVSVGIYLYREFGWRTNKGHRGMPGAARTAVYIGAFLLGLN